MMRLLKLIIGLPGSGKTEYIKTLSGDIVFDDFVDVAHLPDDFDGQMILSDHAFCLHWRVAERILFEKYGCDIEKVFFSNSPDECIHNVAKRGGRVISDSYIRYLSANYEIEGDVIDVIAH